MRGCLIYHIKVLSFFFIYYYTIFKAYCMISVNPQRGNDIDHLYIYAACTKTKLGIVQNGQKNHKS